MDWINSVTDTVSTEVGCIHTVQGYDLNYVGVIFGPEIVFNKETGLIEVIKENYHDRNGKSSIKDPKELHDYILHIYSTLILRGIKGAFLYVMNPDLSAYFARYIQKYDQHQNGKYMVRIALIQLGLENDVLVETSRSVMELAESAETLEDTNRWIACQVQRPGKEKAPGAAESTALLRIVYEEYGQSQPPINTPEPSAQILEAHADHKDYDLGKQSAKWRVAEEENTVYKKQRWQAFSLESTRFMPMYLKRPDGTVYMVIARFERLLDTMGNEKRTNEKMADDSVE